jgi:hypothetical protein
MDGLRAAVEADARLAHGDRVNQQAAP